VKKIILTFIILLSGTGLFAFSVSGKVIDSTTGDGVPGVSVVIEQLKSVTVTSPDGSFAFENVPAGFYTIHTTHPLYTNSVTDIRVKRKFVLDIALKKAVYTAEPIVNSYNKNNMRPGTQSISSDDITYMPMSGAGDSLHLLQTLPGVSGTFTMGTVPVIRGLNPIYDKTYIDDMPVDYPYHYLPPIVPILSSINGTIIDDVEILKGPYPMTYDDSIGSIIHIRTKEAEKPGVHGKIILDPVIPLFPTIYCESAISDFSLIFAGRRTYIDWGADFFEADNSDTWYFQDHYLKLKYNLTPRHRLYFTTLGSDDFISMKDDLDARTQYHIESLKWQYLINRKVFLETSFLRNRTNHYIKDMDTDSADEPLSINYSPLMYRLLQTLTADLSVFDIKTGYEFILHKDGVSGNVDLADLVDYDISDIAGQTVAASFPIEGKTVSVFNETGIDLYPVNLNIGARYKHYGPLSTDTFSYRGIASYYIKNHELKIYGGGGSYHAQPDMYYYLGNDTFTMKESKAYNGVIGLEKKLTQELSGQIETYYARYLDLFSSDFDNIASSQMQKLAQINPYSKDVKGSSMGVECFIKGKIGPVYGWTSYALSRTRMSDGDDEYNSDYDQTHIFKIAALTHQGKWTPSLMWHFATSMPYTPITGSTPDGSGDYDPVYGKYNSKRYSAYHRLDAKLSYTTDAVRFYIEIWNIYYIKGYDRNKDKVIKNESYLYPDFDNNKPYSSSNPKDQSDIPGAFFWAGLEICF